MTVTKDTDPEGGTGPFPVTLAGPNGFSQTKSLAADGSSDTFTAVPADNPYNLTEDLTGSAVHARQHHLHERPDRSEPGELPGAARRVDPMRSEQRRQAGQVIVTKDTDPEGNSGTFPVTLTGPNVYSESANLVDDGGQHTLTRYRPDRATP